MQKGHSTNTQSRFIPTCSRHFSLFSLLDTTPRDKPPEQVSSYQVAPTFCNKSIPSNPKLQLNFVNTELVKPGIRRRGEEGEKFCPFSRQDWKRGSAGMLSVLIKTMMHKTQFCRSPDAARRARGFLGCGIFYYCHYYYLGRQREKEIIQKAERRSAPVRWGQETSKLSG